MRSATRRGARPCLNAPAPLFLNPPSTIPTSAASGGHYQEPISSKIFAQRVRRESAHSLVGGHRGVGALGRVGGDDVRVCVASGAREATRASLGEGLGRDGGREGEGGGDVAEGRHDKECGASVVVGWGRSPRSGRRRPRCLGEGKELVRGRETREFARQTRLGTRSAGPACLSYTWSRSYQLYLSINWLYRAAVHSPGESERRAGPDHPRRSRRETWRSVGRVRSTGVPVSHARTRPC